jgi:hypothetical protein
MAYITPRVLIKQEFLQVPVYREFPLPAFIIGPNYALTRYSEADEKPFTAVATLDGVSLESGNSYVVTADTRYDFPNVPAGGDVDHTYTKVYAESVEAKYFPHQDLPSVPGADDVTFLVGPSGQYYTNRVQLNATLKTTNGYTRDSFFAERDVAVGDIVEITSLDAANNETVVRSRISGLLAETAAETPSLASEVAPQYYANANGVSNGTNLFTSQGADFIESEVVGKYITINGIGVRQILSRPNSSSLILSSPVATGTARGFFIGGVYNDLDNSPKVTMLTGTVTAGGSYTGITTAIGTTSVYVGYPSLNVLEDTYTITVTTGGLIDAARFQVTSLNSEALYTGKSLTVTGSKGVLVVDDNDGNNLTFEFTVSDPLTTTFVASPTAQSWTIAGTRAAVTQVVPDADGDYAGQYDMIYKVKVDRGGTFFDGDNADTCARLIISSSNIDNTSLVLPEADEPFSVGTFGVTAKFASAPIGNAGSGFYFIAGDTYYIPVVAEKQGRVSIIELSEDLPQSVLATATSSSASLFLTQRSIQIPATRNLLTGTTNWDQDGNYITINEGLTTYDPYLAVSGTPVRLPVAAAKIYVEHRDLLQDNVVAIDSVRDLASVTDKLGTVHPDNPLAQGVYDAVLNAQNQIVYFIGVATDDLEGYAEAIKISEKSDKVYSFVPLTFDRTIQDAVIAHVNAYSTPEVGRWRIAWISAQDNKSSVMYDLKPNGDPYTATVTDDPSVAGVQYKLVTVAGAKFIEDGVRPNDVVRLNFKLSPDGEVVYDEYVVDRVRSNSTLLLTTPLAAAITSPIKAQVVRNYTKSERAYNIAHIAGDYNNRRVRAVFPDTYKYGGVTKQGYFAAAGLAGLRSGVVPHQGLTNSEFLGADDLSKVVIEFSQDDLNTLAEQGVWILTQEVVGATPYVRHQLTTDTRSLNTSEDSITTNVDSISYALKSVLAPFIGRYNINRENISAVKAAVIEELRFRAGSTYTVRAGNQLVSFTPDTDIIRLEQNAQYKDRIDVEVRLNVPYPMNYINLTLIVG